MIQEINQELSMKNKYIESLLSEIQQLESKVTNLKENQQVPFSFFKESFKRTQEIARLFHELELVQIEEMKKQMERLVQFLSESENTKPEAKDTPIASVVNSDKVTSSSVSGEQPTAPISDVGVDEVEPKKDDEPIKVKAPIEEVKNRGSSFDGLQDEPALPIPPTASDRRNGEITPSEHSVLNQQKETIVEHLGVKNRSLNDVQPVNHTIQDAKRTISLNDRFLFQRELFDNNREAMNTMMTNLQPFTSFDAIENYLKENTNWNFKDETVDKFMQMLKDSFR